MGYISNIEIAKLKGISFFLQALYNRDCFDLVSKQTKSKAYRDMEVDVSKCTSDIQDRCLNLLMFGKLPYSLLYVF